MLGLLVSIILASWTPPPLSEAVLHVETQPEGALILLDGNLHCRSSPCARFVPPGTYEITALHEEGQTTRRTVQVALPELRVLIELPGT
jgi:hypothetical protein